MRHISLEKPNGAFRWLQLYRLYLSAFPAAERKPFAMIAGHYRKEKMDIWCITEKGQFLGFATTVLGESLVLIDYLAIDKAHRGTGVGSAALAALRKKYAGKGVFLEIESVYEDCPNLQERQRRKAFYLHCGMEPMQVMIRLFGVKMELMGFDCRFDYACYEAFYMKHLGAWAAGHVFPENHPEADPNTPS